MGWQLVLALFASLVVKHAFPSLVMKYRDLMLTSAVTNHSRAQVPEMKTEPATYWKYNYIDGAFLAICWKFLQKFLFLKNAAIIMLLSYLP